MPNALAILSEITRKDIVVGGNADLAGLDGWDSLKTVKLVLRLEEVIGRDLLENDIESLRTVADVDRLLKSGG